MNNSVAVTLMRAAHRIEVRLEEALAKVELSGPKFVVLSVLIGEDRPISLGEMATKLTCVRSNVTQLVDRLETDGLVRRTDDPSDRRVVRAEVTPLGRERHGAGVKIVNPVLQDIEQEMAAVDPDVLKRVFESIR